MRTLKKTLCVVLAAVLMLSFCVVGASATTSLTTSFSDSSAITYKEAVDVLNGIGVINGMDNGSFDPTGLLTREQAAKIICYMMLGKTQAEALRANSAPFNDVAADRWSAGFISYCASEKIIVGVGDNNFDPTGKLTGYQWAKMLLVALGYDPEVEEFTGASWAINVAKKALGVGIFDGNLNGNFVTNCTREEACLYAYNTLKADMVEYKTQGTSINVGNTTITTGGSSATKVPNTLTAANSYNGVADQIEQFIEQYWSKLKLDDTATNSFGAPSDKWTYKGETVGTYANDADGSIVINSIGSSSKRTLGYWIDEISTDLEYTGTTVLYINGFKATAADYVWGTNLALGDAITVYTDDSNTDTIKTIVITKYTGEKITDVDTSVSTTDSKNGITAYVTIDGTDYKPGSDTKSEKLPGYASSTYVKDAILGVAYMYTSASAYGTTILGSYVAKSAEGTVSAYVAAAGTTAGSITLGGTKYTIGGNIDVNKYVANDYTGTYAAYVDGNGLVIYIDTVEAGKTASEALSVAYLYSKTKADDYNVNATTQYAQVVDMKGTASVLKLGYTTSAGKILGYIGGYTYTRDDSTGTYYVLATGAIATSGTALVTTSTPKYTRSAATVEQYGLYTSSYQSGDDYYKLKACSDTSTIFYAPDYSYTSAIKSTDTRIGSYRISSTTQFIIVEGTGSNIDVTVKTGSASVAAGYDAIGVISAKSGSSYIAQYVIVNTADYSSGNYDDLLYYKSGSLASVDGGYSVALYDKTGTKADYKITNDSLSGAHFYKYSIDSKGFYTLTVVSGDSVTNAKWSDIKTEKVFYDVTFVETYNGQLTLTDGTHTITDITASSVVIIDNHETNQDDYSKTGYTTYSGAIASLDKMGSVKDNGYTITFNAYLNDDGAVILFVKDASKATSTYTLTGTTFYADAACTGTAITSALVGSTVYFKLAADTTGITGATVTLVSGTALKANAIYSFTMPAANTTITIA